MSADIGLVGLGVMGQNLALNIAEKGFTISVFNRTYSKTEETVKRAEEEGKGKYKLHGYKELKDFIASIRKPRPVIMLITAGKAVDLTIQSLLEHMEPGDTIIDGGNEWYENTDRRAKEVTQKGILYMGMGVSGGEEGARHGPSLMPGGPREAYQRLEPILTKIAAQVDDGPCVTYIGPGSSGNYVKMIHNGIEYGDMELIAEIYDLLRNVAGLDNQELHKVFDEWNKGELQSFLIELTARVLTKRDEKNPNQFLIDVVMDKSGSKGTGKWTIQEGAERGVPLPTMSSALDARYMSALKEERVKASKILKGPPHPNDKINKEQLINDLRHALYSSKICSYAQGMNIIKEASKNFDWGLELGKIARIWKGGCIIRAKFLDRIKSAYDKDANLASLLVDDSFAKEIAERQEGWRRVIKIAIEHGIPVPSLSASLAYYDSYRRERLPANLIQAQRDFFGAHTYERTDNPGVFVHSEWNDQ
jgi:6-phosphogluconate dehydrogenase